MPYEGPSDPLATYLSYPEITIHQLKLFQSIMAFSIANIRANSLILVETGMGKIIVTEFISLDGVIEAPGGDETAHPHGGWQTQYTSAKAGKYKVTELANVDALLLGRTTYQGFAAYWPGQVGVGLADPINKMPKYVVSKSLEEVDWNNSHILRDVPTAVTELKASEGGNILVYGSGKLVKSLLHHNLVDELRLMVYPVVLGGGLKLFDDNLELKKLELKRSEVFEEGIVMLEYLPSS